MLLWFGAVEHDVGTYVYEVRPWTGNSTHSMYNQRVETNCNVYLGFHELTPIVGPLWRLEPGKNDTVRMTTLDGKEVGVYWDKAAWTTGPRGRYLCMDGGRYHIGYI